MLTSKSIMYLYAQIMFVQQINYQLLSSLVFYQQNIITKK